jgi:hypothetical protein
MTSAGEEILICMDSCARVRSRRGLCCVIRAPMLYRNRYQKNDKTKKYQQALLGIGNQPIGTHRNPLAEKSLLIP